LEGRTRVGLKNQRDVIRVDRGRGQDAVVDGLERSHVGKVDVHRLADARGFRLDVLVDGVEQRGAPDLGLVVLVGPGHQGLEKCSEIVGHEGASWKNELRKNGGRGTQPRKARTGPRKRNEILKLLYVLFRGCSVFSMVQPQGSLAQSPPSLPGPNRCPSVLLLKPSSRPGPNLWPSAGVVGNPTIGPAAR